MGNALWLVELPPACPVSCKCLRMYTTPQQAQLSIAKGAGDFHQLPPVVKREAAGARAFAFEAACWASCVDASLRLSHVYRQVQHLQSLFLVVKQ